MALYELFSEYELGHTFYAIFRYFNYHIHPLNIYYVFSITNSLVVTGKTINFILFCLSSEHFRQKCFKAIYRKFPKVRRGSCGGAVNHSGMGVYPENAGIHGAISASWLA